MLVTNTMNVMYIFCCTNIFGSRKPHGTVFDLFQGQWFLTFISFSVPLAFNMLFKKLSGLQYASDCCEKCKFLDRASLCDYTKGSKCPSEFHCRLTTEGLYDERRKKKRGIRHV